MKTFAYGSNMHIDRLKERTPSLVKVTNAKLIGYKFKCNKVSNTGSSKGNIEYTGNPKDVVYGVIYEIDDKEKKSLDEHEALGKGYNETMITVADEQGAAQETQVYIADPLHIDNALEPFDWYRDYIISGAEQNGLPKEYIDELKKLPSKVDTDKKRREKNYRIMGKQAE